MTTATAKTTHKENCTRVFKNYDLTCPRCIELSNGASPRKAWNWLKKQNDEQQIRAIHAHFAVGGPHDRGECGPCCTAFDY